MLFRNLVKSVFGFLVSLVSKISCVDFLSRFDLGLELLNLLHVFFLLVGKLDVSLVLFLLLVLLVHLLLSLLGHLLLSSFL
jgi:hypothetical protein